MAKRQLTLVGTEEQQKDFDEYMERGDDPCFGKHFSKSAEECNKCVAPVVVDGEMCLMREVCEARTKGADDPSDLNRLTSQDVLDRLQSGHEIEDIFQEILDGKDPDVKGVTARQVLYQRLSYLENKYELDMPDLPKTKELTKQVNQDEN